MPRKKLIRSTTLPYHITARTNNREPFSCSLDQAWKCLTFALFETEILYGSRPHAFVLMPNHFHLLMSTPNEDLGVVMQRMMGSATKSINRVSGRTGRVFGAKYFQTLVDSPLYFAHAFKYIYRNPVRARLCETVEGYPLSTLACLGGERPLPMPLYYPYGRSDLLIIPKGPVEQLRWLNQPFRAEIEEAIRKSLTKTVFAPPKQGWKRTIAEFMNQSF